MDQLKTQSNETKPTYVLVSGGHTHTRLAQRQQIGSPGQWRQRTTVTQWSLLKFSGLFLEVV